MHRLLAPDDPCKFGLVKYSLTHVIIFNIRLELEVSSLTYPSSPLAETNKVSVGLTTRRSPFTPDPVRPYFRRSQTSLRFLVHVSLISKDGMNSDICQFKSEHT